MQYADDINMSVLADTLEELQLRLNLEQWCVKKRLVLHPKKSSLMYLSRYGKSDSNVNGIYLIIKQSRFHQSEFSELLYKKTIGTIILIKYGKKLNSANFTILQYQNVIQFH
jgi:hypothetical protein